MAAHLPVPFRAGNTIVRRETEICEDAYLTRYARTFVDWKDHKGKLHEDHTLYVKWFPRYTIHNAWDLAQVMNLSSKDVAAEDIYKYFEDFLGPYLPEQDLYVTIGVYRNAPESHFVVNVVKREHIYAHIWYNIHNRWGRTFFVENTCFNCGIYDTRTFYRTRVKVAEKITEIRSRPLVPSQQYK
jgi:hypothetical protein